MNYVRKYQNFSARLAARSLASAACAIWLLAAFAPVLAAQSIAPDAPPAEATETVEQTIPVEPAMAPYQIGLGDVLAIAVWQEPAHSMASIVVRPDGKISLPLLREVYVNGLTPLEAEDLLTDRFKEFINNPNVTVIVREIRSQIIYITGGVGRPGSMLLQPGMTVFQALSEAGGIADYAKVNKMYIVRDVDGTRTTIDYDYKAVMKGEVEKDFVLKTGDTIVVPD